MRITCLIFISFSFLCHYIFCPVLSAKGYTQIPEVNELISDTPKQKDAYHVLKEVNEKIKNDPADPNNYESLALIYNSLDMYDKAAEAILQQIRHYPKDGRFLYIIYANLAQEYLASGDLHGAKSSLDKAFKLNPQDAMLHSYLANYHILKKQYQQAALELKAACDLDSEKDFYYDSYIYAFDNMQNKTEAVRLFQEAVKVNPGSHFAHRALATAIRNSSSDLEKDFPVIIAEFNRALEINRGYLPTYISIANAYMFRGLQANDKVWLEESMRWFNKAYKLDPKNVRLAYGMANFFVYTQQYDKAIKKLTPLIAQGNNAEPLVDCLARAYNGKAYSYYLKGSNLDKGLEIIEQALKLRPNDGMFLSTKAELLYKMGRLREAYDYIKTAIALEPDEPEIKQDLKNIKQALLDSGGQQEVKRRKNE
ncbi:MAG: tetratricopeptide repeat protein [Candidatus Omnitrophota bacterium]